MRPLSPFALSIALLAFPLLHGHESPGAHPHPPEPYPAKDYHRPTPMPDRLVLTWSGDPSTTQAITWRTDTSVTRAIAQLALATDRPQVTSGDDRVATTTVFASDLGTAHYHAIELRDLSPATTYAYRVGDGVNWTEWQHFRTAKQGAAPFTFVYFGDAQNDVRTHWSRVFREAFRSAPQAAFTLHAGDLINRAQRDAEWGEWFGAPGWVNGTVPTLPTPGNHEYWNRGAGPENQRLWTIKEGSAIPVSIDLKTDRDRAGKATGYRLAAITADGRGANATFDAKELFTSVDAGFTTLTGYTMADLAGREADNPPLRDRVANPGVRTLSDHWRVQFTLPRHGPDGLDESVYFVDYQGARIISLNSNERQEDQVAWLRRVLTENPQRWTILTFHHPIFSPARGRDNAKLREIWKPLLDEFKVDLVLTGHDHTYARSGDVSNRARVGSINVLSGYNQVYDPAIGTVYVVSVSGPKMYDLTNDSWAVRTAEDTQLFQVISVDADELHFESRTATGRIYDAFTLKKRPGQPNALVEALPPEIRRTRQ